MQELMRHSSLRSTLDVYTKAVGSAKRAAQAAVFSLFSTLPNSKDDCEIVGLAWMESMPVLRVQKDTNMQLFCALEAQEKLSLST
jgi:hypothetical protein